MRDLDDSVILDVIDNIVDPEEDTLKVLCWCLH